MPAVVCDKLYMVVRRFWWNPRKVAGNFLAWKSWDQLYYPKAGGGLGFRKAKIFNDALLAKITWMVISNRDSLRIRALISKYKVRSDWMDREAPKHASQTWKAIERQKKIIEKGACFIVGDGAAIDIWKDP